MYSSKLCCTRVRTIVTPFFFYAKRCSNGRVYFKRIFDEMLTADGVLHDILLSMCPEFTIAWELVKTNTLTGGVRITSTNA